MKSILAALMITLLVVGCDQSSPVDSNSDLAQQEATFSELSMYNTTQAPSTVQIITADSGRQFHDSLRNMRMLDSLKAYLSLTDEQFTSVKTYGATLFATLADIRNQVMSKTITREEAKTLVIAARDQFVTSVKSILTADQLTLFTTWLEKHWNKPPHRGVPGGRKGHGGPGGRHGGPGGRP